MSPPPPASPIAVTPLDHRRRLMEAMGEVVARKGFAVTTIADLAAQAKVSRRTFYEHFASKSECLIALYEAASRQALEVMVSAIDPSLDWRERVHRALNAYLATLASNPVLLSTLFIEILGLGAPGLAARRRVNEALAALLVEQARSTLAPGAADLPRPLALGAVGAINELILEAVEDGRADRLPELATASTDLVWAITQAAA